MNTGAFGEGFPYTNFHDLNMDWIIKIAKDFLDQYSNIQYSISNGLTQITDTVETGKNELNTLTNEELGSLEAKAQKLTGLLDAWYNTHSSDIANQLATAIANLNTYANTKLAEVLAQIPDDYTVLNAKVDLKVDKSGYKQVTPDNLQIITGYNNLFNPYTRTNGYYITRDGNMHESPNYFTSDYIPVSPGTSYMYIGRVIPDAEEGGNITTFFRTYVFYDANKNVLTGSDTETPSPITSPENAYFIRFSANIVYNYNSFYAGSEHEPYKAYGFNAQFVDNKYLDFMNTGANLVNPQLIVTGYISQTDGGLYSNDNYRATPYIEVIGGIDYTISLQYATPTAEIRYAFYTDDKTYITGDFTTLSAINNTVTAPVNAKYIRFSAYYAYGKPFLGQGIIPAVYEPYGLAYINPNYIRYDFNPILNIPHKIYAFVGLETNIYFENITVDYTKYKWNIDCSKGKQMQRGFQITPTNADIGTYTLSITCYDDKASKTVTTTLIITEQNSGAGDSVKVLVLGDSTTANGYCMQKLTENFSTDPTTLELIGTLGTYPNHHEGRSGWTFNEYMNNSMNNPFYNPQTEQFDASYYFTTTHMPYPDWFVINLGINDMFSYTADDTLETGINNVIDICDRMISSIKNADASIKVGLCITIPPNHSQDAFGKAYACGQTRDRYKRNNALFANRLIQEYDNRETDRIYLIPIHTNLDTIYNMGLENTPVNSRNTETYKSPIANGGVHPIIEGYWQIADMYMAFIKAYMN